MTTRIGGDGPATGVTATVTAPRVTPEPARPFQQVMSASSSAIVSGAEAAVARLPGGPVLAASMRPGGSGAVLPSTLNNGLGRAEGPTGTAAASTASGLPSVSGTSASGDANMDQVLSQDADQNMYFLELQERMSAESRSYSAISNVLKTRHDTMKNAIGNIR
jgi:hypothetical protein